MFDDAYVAQVTALIDLSGLPEWIDDRHGSFKVKVGRSTRVSIRAVMVALLLGVLDGRGFLLSEMTKTLFFRLPPASRSELGISTITAPSGNRTSATAKTAQKAAYAAVRRTFHRLNDTINPSIHRGGRKRTWQQVTETNRPLTDSDQAERLAALDLFTTTLLACVRHLLPESAWKTWDGSACLDGTPVPLWANGRGKDSVWASSDPDGGYHQRTGAHGEDPNTKVNKQTFALEAHAMVAADIFSEDRQYMPAFVLAVAMARPGVDPAGHARRLMAAMSHIGHTPGYLTGDGLYTDLIPDTFQTEARALGWKLLIHITDKHLHRTPLAGGVIGVEGGLYCPSLPDTLVEATADFRAGRIDLPTYRARINNRAIYQMRVHDTLADGRVRLDCPAAGACPKAICPLKPKSAEPRPTTLTPAGQKIDTRPTIKITKHVSKDHPPKVCAAAHVTINLADYARYYQDIPYGSPEWDHIYNTLRNAQEGIHGYAKDPAHEDLAQPGKRRVGGLGATSIFTAFAFLAANIRKVNGFLTNAVEDEQGRLYVPRHKTNTIPAAPPPEQPARRIAA